MASAVSPVSASNGVDTLCSMPACEGEEDETGRSRGQLGACALVSLSPELGPWQWQVYVVDGGSVLEEDGADGRVPHVNGRKGGRKKGSCCCAVPCWAKRRMPKMIFYFLFFSRIYSRII
jgi:hypothetical protein